jgi:EAL domain-containing protein (putative c-di-GMP-specific phosphodiesterase class I)
LPPSARTLLGFAFTAGDLLLELDAEGTVLEAVGAAQALLGVAETTLPGTAIESLTHETDQPLVTALLAVTEEGRRRGPIPLRLARDGEHGAVLTLRSLPGNGGRLSCALTGGPMPVRPPGDGLYDRNSFEAFARGLGEAARATGRELELAMVELTGLARVRAALDAKAAMALDAKVGGALRSEIGALGAAARLGDERFAVVRQAGGSPATTMARDLSRALAMAGEEITVSAQAAPMDSASPSRLGRAMRYALDDFITEGLKDHPPASMAEAMNRSVRRTLARAGELGMAVSQRRFTLAFQPVVRLSDGSLHHHEALVRFEENASPFAMVRLAEEFDLIEELDRAVVEQAVRRLRGDRTGALTLAVNISGRSVGSSPFIEGLQRLISATPNLAGRLIFEITESAAIDDLALANRHIQALRKTGSLVCLDDYGSGAASLAYLQALTVDIVKIDGRYVRDLAGGGRDAALVRHLVKLCAELKVRTVAEMVETREAEEAARAAGVDLGQGWWYGRPADVPEAPARHDPLPARRMGASESWR